MSDTRIFDTDYADVALYDKVNAIANEIDAETIHKLGEEQIDGEKTFTVSPKVPTPTDDSDDEVAVNKAFVKRFSLNLITFEEY